MTAAGESMSNYASVQIDPQEAFEAAAISKNQTAAQAGAINLKLKANLERRWTASMTLNTRPTYATLSRRWEAEIEPSHT